MNAMQACQRKYDNMTPDDSDCFLDTNEGCNWQDGAATHLMSGNDYSVNSWTGVTYGELCDFVIRHTFFSEQATPSPIEAVRRGAGLAGDDRQQPARRLLGRIRVA